MKLPVAIARSLFLLPVAAFCAFGFLATFEPASSTTRFMAFRIGYAVAGMSCLIGTGFGFFRASRK